MKSSIEFSKKRGWISSDEMKCRYCDKVIPVGDKGWFIENANHYVCNECFTIGRKNGLLRNINRATPVKRLEAKKMEYDGASKGVWKDE